MKLRKDSLVVTLEDAKFYFSIPSRKKFYEKAATNSYEDMCAEALERVEGLEDEAGNKIEDLKVFELPIDVWKKLFNAWLAEMMKLLGVAPEAEQKNVIS
jgi:hypothetical protein